MTKKSVLHKIKDRSLTQKEKSRLRVAVSHTFTEGANNNPPCDTCVAACCRVFIVPLTKEEYESGIYKEHAVHVPAGLLDTDKTHMSAIYRLGAQMVFDGKEHFIMEGLGDEPCPFLRDNKCSIYEDRPLTCRGYSCIDDPRITDAVRKGNYE